MSGFSLRARWVLPVEGRPIEGGYVSIEAGRIASVGAARPAGNVTDLGDVVLLPGLVNAHTHLEFSDLAAPLGASGMPLPAWIRLVISERKRGRRVPATTIAAGLRESLAAGVTTVGEISTNPAAAYGGAGHRPGVVGFQESIGFSGLRADSAFADVERRFELAAAPAGLSPHAPYTVHPRLLERIVELASVHGAPVAMHLAESREELELLAERSGDFRTLLEERGMWDAEAIPRGSRPLDYLRRLAAAPRALVIHGNYLAADEMELLGQRRATMSLAFCPRTHAFFEHEAYPLSDLRAAGVRVVLGTDSRASNPDLDLLAELRFGAARVPGVDPAAWVQMATRDAAIALGVGDEAGTLEPGKRADLIALPCSTCDDPYAAIAAGDAHVERVWLAGVEVVTPAPS